MPQHSRTLCDDMLFVLACTTADTACVLPCPAACCPPHIASTALPCPSPHRTTSGRWSSPASQRCTATAARLWVWQSLRQWRTCAQPSGAWTTPSSKTPLRRATSASQRYGQAGRQRNQQQPSTPSGLCEQRRLAQAGGAGLPSTTCLLQSWYHTYREAHPPGVLLCCCRTMGTGAAVAAMAVATEGEVAATEVAATAAEVAAGMAAGTTAMAATARGAAQSAHAAGAAAGAAPAAGAAAGARSDPKTGASAAARAGAAAAPGAAAGETGSKRGGGGAGLHAGHSTHCRCALVWCMLLRLSRQQGSLSSCSVAACVAPA